MTLTHILTTAAVCALAASGVQAQRTVATQPQADRISTSAPVAKKSPMNSASLRTDDGYARIIYSQPMLRGRKMLGEELAFGELWRLGANEATEIFLTEQMEIGPDDAELDAGAYSVFAIPGEEAWTLVFNSKLGEWGAYGYDESLDVLRVEVPVTVGDESYEAFTIFFEPAAEDAGDDADDMLVMAWGPYRAAAEVAFDD